MAGRDVHDMADPKRIPLLIDTSYLRGTSLHDPDFMRLLHFSRENLVHVFIPAIVWEEWRTQWVDGILKKISSARDAFESLNEGWKGFVIEGLAVPSIRMLNENEIHARSKDVLSSFSKEHRIEVVPIAKAHAERAWQRYFHCAQPFQRGQKREDRRKHIPDAWILEAAIDLVAQHPKLVALCRDGNLSDALRSVDITVYGNTDDILSIVDEMLLADAAEKETSSESEDSESVGIEEKGAPDQLGVMLANSAAQFRDLETKVLGYVGVYSPLSKEQLLALLSREGVAADAAENTAGRLVLAQLIRDTGNHYLPANKEACELAAATIEPDLIKMLES